MKHARTMIQQAILLGILIFGTWGFGGCTVIGYMIGGEIDDGRQDRDTLFVNPKMNPGPGDDVRALLSDSTVIEGEFAGLDALDESDYERRYARFRKEHEEIALPMPGDTLIGRFSAGKATFVSVFHGFGDRTLTIRMVNQSAVVELRFTQASTMALGNGTQLDLAMLESMSKAGRLPRNISVVVQTEANAMRIPLDDILLIERINTRNARWIAGGFGLAVDAAIIIIMSTRHHTLNWFSFGGGF